MKTENVMNIIGLSAVSYIGISYLLFNTIGAKTYFEATGYINGLVRGSGSKSVAQTNLDNWKSYWDSMKATGFIVDMVYSHGINRIKEIYG